MRLLVVPWKDTSKVVVIDKNCMDTAISSRKIRFRESASKAIVIQVQVSQADIVGTEIRRQSTREIVVSQVHVKHLA